MHFPSLTMSFNTITNVFPQFGMYSNACGVSEWTYTGVKHYEKVSFINSLDFYLFVYRSIKLFSIDSDYPFNYCFDPKVCCSRGEYEDCGTNLG